MDSVLDDAFGHWLAGFVDGEGCFYIGPSAGRGYIFRFLLTLRADDAEILKECRTRTGLGRVEPLLKGRGTSAPQARWVVERKLDCFLLIAIFDTYPLRAKKARDYAIWREAVMRWHEIPSNARINIDWEPIAALSAELRAGREFSR